MAECGGGKNCRPYLPLYRAAGNPDRPCLQFSLDAAAAFHKATKLNPADDEMWYKFALILSILERYDEAVDAFQNAIEINSVYAEAWYYFGTLLELLNRDKEAEEALRRAKELGCSPE